MQIGIQESIPSTQQIESRMAEERPHQARELHHQVEVYVGSSTPILVQGYLCKILPTKHRYTHRLFVEYRSCRSHVRVLFGHQSAAQRYSMMHLYRRSQRTSMNRTQKRGCFERRRPA